MWQASAPPSRYNVPGSQTFKMEVENGQSLMPGDPVTIGKNNKIKIIETGSESPIGRVLDIKKNNWCIVSIH